MIVYTADHGEFLGFHHLLLKGNYLYEPLIKVPLIIKFPGHRLVGKVCSALVSSIDVTSTILAATGVKPGPDMRGHSLESVCAGNQPGREYLFAEDGSCNMVRSRTRKLLLCATSSNRSLFFDLERDPLEKTNLFHEAAYQTEIRELKEHLLHWFQTETQAEPHVNPEAPQIVRPNVPRSREASEREMEDYFKRQMDKVLPAR